MKGVVYQITSPSGKSYIGQTQNFLSNGKKKGFNIRWKQHINSAFGKNPEKGCRLLNNAIRKYSPSSFNYLILIETDIDKLDLFEEFYIKIKNTLVPNGYNLQKGGTFTKHSKETCEKRSKSLKKLLENPEKRKIWSEVKKGKQQSKKRNRKNDQDNSLPKYILHYKSGKYEGYEVNSHPKCKSKKFTKSKMTMNEKLNLAKNFVKSLETI